MSTIRGMGDAGAWTLACVVAASGCGPETRPAAEATHTVSQAVIAGATTPDGYQFPIGRLERGAVVGFVYHVGRESGQGCSGTIIGDRLVVAAAHCVVENQDNWLAGNAPVLVPASQIRFVVGDNVLQPDCTLNAVEVHVHPLASQLSDSTIAHDISLTVVEESVREICPGVLPLQVNREPLSTSLIHEDALQGGFGSVDGTYNFSPVRYWSLLDISRISDTMVVAENIALGFPTYGDSGSGLLHRFPDGTLRVLGVASVGGINDLMGFIRLDVDGDFLDSVITEGSLCGQVTASGSCVEDTVVSCDNRGFLARDCRDAGLSCALDSANAAHCTCACDSLPECQPECGCDPECLVDAGSAPAAHPGDSSDNGGKRSSGCGAAVPGPFALLGMALLGARRRRTVRGHAAPAVLVSLIALAGGGACKPSTDSAGDAGGSSSGGGPSDGRAGGSSGSPSSSSAAPCGVRPEGAACKRSGQCACVEGEPLACLDGVCAKQCAHAGQQDRCASNQLCAARPDGTLACLAATGQNGACARAACAAPLECQAGMGMESSNPAKPVVDGMACHQPCNYGAENTGCGGSEECLPSTPGLEEVQGGPDAGVRCNPDAGAPPPCDTANGFRCLVRLHEALCSRPVAACGTALGLANLQPDAPPLTMNDLCNPGPDWLWESGEILLGGGRYCREFPELANPPQVRCATGLLFGPAAPGSAGLCVALCRTPGGDGGPAQNLGCPPGYFCDPINTFMSTPVGSTPCSHDADCRNFPGAQCVRDQTGAHCAYPLPNCQPAGAGRSDIDTACAEYAMARCARTNTCVPHTLEFLYGDLATCMRRVELSCVESAKADGATVTAQAIRDCAQAKSTQSCPDVMTARTPDPCAWTGLLELGASCHYGPQCRSGMCRVPPGGACGACAEQVALGGSCLTASDCERGLYCDRSGVCAEYGTQGALCDQNHRCRRDFACQGGVCVPVVGEGAACDPANDTCDLAAGLTCNTQSNTCQVIQFGAPGIACGTIHGQPALCRASGTCLATDDAAQGTCVAAVADGEACTTTAGPACMSPAVCVSGRCVLPGAAACP